MKKKPIKYITWIFFVSVGAFFLVKIYYGFLKLNKDYAEILPSTYTLTTDDSNLICKNFWPKLKVIEVARNRQREPVSFIYFDNTYRLVITKFLLSDDIMIKDLIQIQNASVDRSTGQSYRVFDNEIPFRLQFRGGNSMPISKVLMTMAGDSLVQNLKTDSSLGYRLLCKNFSIRFSNDTPIDIFFEGKSYNHLIPIDILFVKKSNLVFLLLMSADNPNIGTPPDLLKNIVFGVCE